MATNNVINLNASGIVSYNGAGTFSALANPLTVTNGGTGVSSNTTYAVICGGTTNTNPVQSIASVGTSGQYLLSNGPGSLPTFQTPTATTGYITFQCTSNVTATWPDGQIYYTGYNGTSFGGTLSSASASFVMPVSGTINHIQGAYFVAGTLASSENMTLAFRKNNTTDTTITSTFKLNSATNVVDFSSVGLSVTAGDTIAVKATGATWATNPSNTSATLTFLLSV